MLYGAEEKASFEEMVTEAFEEAGATEHGPPQFFCHRLRRSEHGASEHVTSLQRFPNAIQIYMYMLLRSWRRVPTKIS